MPVVAHVARAIAPAPATDGQPRIRPLLNYYYLAGCSRFVRGQASRDTHPTKHSHVNAVVIESGWEVRVAKVLDDLAEEGRLQALVEDNFIEFRIPYADAAGQDRLYYPDFTLRIAPPKAKPAQLIVEVSGMKRDKPEKKWAVQNRLLPAVESVRAQRGLLHWTFLELDEELAVNDAGQQILENSRIVNKPPAFHPTPTPCLHLQCRKV